MRAEIITIGDEILIGQIVDTNSAWMGEQLGLNGIAVKQITSVSDDAAHIVNALDEAQTRADLILITGGLGPTKDDITKKTLRTYFGMGWRTDEQVQADVIAIFKRFGREPGEVNMLQAEVPDGCRVIRNKNGTAPGMWFEHNGKIFVSMPGVPFEMKGIMTDGVLPLLREKFSLPFIYHRTVLTQGVGESILAAKIEAWEDSLAALGIKLAYLPSPGLVRLRLSASGNEQDIRRAVDAKVEELLPQIEEWHYGFGHETLPQVIGKILLERGQTLATAESCTGGSVAQAITSVPGSSQWYQGSIVSYANEIKIQQLDIPAELIAQHGAVSEEVAAAMAANARTRLGTDFAVSTTGIAGPGGGSALKPVGLVYIAVASANGVIVKRFQYGGDRSRNITAATLSALMLLRKVVLGHAL
ncbi:MAG: competence/damage-inducible protein A [Bacteroidia bacterium]|jgi:nicotinamide-nucleotide amidase|nr:competence/damage-inducible protein A [Bacteroidia bacterium]